jgi:high-affinity nickel-transport protein
LVSILRIFRKMRQGEYDKEELEEQLGSRGFMNRFFGRFTRTVKQPWQMYPIGLLFGLGFDTASEVALLVLAAVAGATGLPWCAILCLPILFAARDVAARHARTSRSPGYQSWSRCSSARSSSSVC